MKKYGRLKEHKKDGNIIYISFEKGELEIQIITGQIIRVFSRLSEERPVSKAIEGDKVRKVAFAIEEDEKSVQIHLPKLTVQVFDEAKVDIYDKDGKPVCIDYRGERVSSQSLDQKMLELLEREGHSTQENADGHVIQVLKKLDGDECFYGLGDKTGFLNKRGYEYMNWNTDDPDPHVDSFRALYKSIPFFITLKKDTVFGLFFDNTFRTYFDMGKESDDYYWFGGDQGNLDYYFIGGDSMKDVVKGYTYLTGTAPLPQMWMLGYHQSRWGYQCEADIRKIAESMREYHLPCDVIHMDIDYMEKYKVFTVDETRFPDMKKLTDDLSDMGIRLVTIMDPGVKVEKGYEVYDTGVEKGYFALDEDGQIYENAVWPGDAVYPDFGKDEVRDWWGENHRMLMESGISGIWNDMNEPASFKGELPENVVFYDGGRKSTHAEMHNVYGHNMARATYQGLKKLTGKRPFVITRACYSGSQKYAIAWTGDNHSIWAHLQMAIPQLCNLGLSGIPYVGTDIGGFGSDATKELMCRWIEVGCFSPFCRNHSAMGTRRQEPWTFDQEVLDIYRKYLNLRYELLPYLYDLCHVEEQEGLPLMRPLVMNYEKDEETKNLNGQFMVGDHIMVAPVTEQGMRQKLIYFPEGEWYDYWTGEKIQGGQYKIRHAELDECPIFVKAGGILPKYPPRLSTSEEKDKVLILEVYPGKAEYVHYQDNGEDFHYQEGEYNLYRFSLDGNELSMELIHQGYEKMYETLVIRYQGEERVVKFEHDYMIILE
ncbi:glycoside hydrolase family 31 protein [Faecalicatena contorta]|uniref:glycoside hydrolase family 31 protein n=1 Tax=Faecalicatena contorta TaxID=39482 RepID=UPI001F1FDBE4|nr:glycoside hydrolase family 31 protein [Faecalicatena contorta]MCF2667466.1 glycoside hydrolase family 31 protein [Faecalicatena contorta]